jgi:simple sugar transport system substrate-binding protein
VTAYSEKNPKVKATFSYDAYEPTKAEPVARQLLAAGAKVLVLHSFALNDVAHKLAGEFQQVPVSVSSFDPPAQPNLSIATASYLQIGYSNCYLLSKLSKAGVVGFVGAMPIPYATELQKGCELGAAAANPQARVIAAYSNSFSDLQATREQAQALVDQGADALFPASATEDSLGGFQLCEQRQIPCAGWASDIRRYAPNYGVASAVLDWSGPLAQLIDQANSGTLKADTFNATFGNGALSPQPFEGASASLVSAELQADYLAVVDKLGKREISWPPSEAHPCCE